MFGKRTQNWVNCPVCGKEHHIEPRGEALQHHRMKLMLCSLEKVQEWNRILKENERTK